MYMSDKKRSTGVAVSASERQAGERNTISHLRTCGDAPVAHGHTWLSQPLSLSITARSI